MRSCWLIVRDRGHVSTAVLQTFLDAGYTRRIVLEVVLAYSQKIKSNYTNHMAKTPLDMPFQKFA